MSARDDRIVEAVRAFDAAVETLGHEYRVELRAPAIRARHEGRLADGGRESEMYRGGRQSQRALDRIASLTGDRREVERLLAALPTQTPAELLAQIRGAS